MAEETKKQDVPSEEELAAELAPEEKEVADALVALIEKEGQWEETPEDLTDTMTEEALEAFVMGEKTLAQVLGMNMEEAYSIAELAYTLLEQGNLDDAQGLVEGLVVLNPYDAYFHNLLGSVYLKQGKTDDALIEYSTALELDDKDVSSYVNRGEILLKMGEFDLALEDFKKAIELDPEGNDPMSNRARMLVTVTTMVIRKTLERKQPEASA